MVCCVDHILDQGFVEVVQVFGFFYVELWRFGGSVDRVLDTIDSAIVDQFVGFAEYPVVERDGENKIRTNHPIKTGPQGRESLPPCPLEIEKNDKSLEILSVFEGFEMFLGF